MNGPHERWLEKAEDDLRFARLGLKESFFNQVCFLSQQAVEKTLKAFLVSKNELYPKTHKLVDLAVACLKHENGLEKFMKELRVLDEYYIPTRYPDAIPGSVKGYMPTKKQAEEALGIAEKVLKYVIERI